MAESPEVYYYSRGRLLYVGISFALSPSLMYIFKLWELPPTTFHYLAYLAGLIAGLIFIFYQWNRPQLTFDKFNLICGDTIPLQDIVLVKPAVGSMTLIIEKGQEHEIKKINMQWASRKNMKKVLKKISDHIHSRHTQGQDHPHP